MLDQHYPGYGLAKHKGYPTAQHRQALVELGITEIHRKSFGPVKRLVKA
jgi:ribonuclease HII